MPAVRRIQLLLVLSAAACGGSAADHDILGDRAYVGHQFSDALIEYRLAIKQRPTPALRAKAGAAALRVGDLGEAAVQYVALAKESKERRGEAADGLERVARKAMTDGDRAGLAAALAGLRQLSAGRALGSFAVALARGITESGSAGDAIAVLPFAAAAAPDARAQDSLMLQYSRALMRADRCADAAPTFEALVRRQREPGVVRTAEAGFLQCALALGKQAVDSGRPQEAEDWYRRAASGSETPLSRAAYLSLGDMMLIRSDFAGAADAYLRAIGDPAAGDSVAERAREKLATLSNAGTVTR